LAEHDVTEVGFVEIACDAHDRLVDAVVVDRGDPGPACGPDEPAGERAGALAHIFFCVTVFVPKREEFHELAGQVFIRRAGAVANAVQPEQHCRVRQHRVREGAEVTEFEGAQLLVLMPHPFGGGHLLRRGCEMVVPQQRELLVYRLVHRGHAPHPPRRQVGHLIEQRAGELLEFSFACTVVGKGRGDGHRTRRRYRPGISVGIEAEHPVEVGRPVLVHDGVDLRSGRAETGAPQEARRSKPPW
jgi:hypothetical protein